ncbi:hypothetical protein L1765_11500, partial [Microaerobacter geothermalis]|uniref:hypothetical protein n=1 Tax=Microaerobacter geothermalis TaxID=674972 RepID=UPI001F2F96B6
LNQLFNDFVTLQLFFAQSYSLLSHSDIFTDALQYDNITDVQHNFFYPLLFTYGYFIISFVAIYVCARSSVG